MLGQHLVDQRLVAHPATACFSGLAIITRTLDVWAAVLNAQRTGSPVVFLTHLGGGAFGNDRARIDAAMRRVLHLGRGLDLDVRIVSYRQPDASALRLVAEFA